MAIFAVLMDDSVFAKQFDEFCKADENTQEGVDMLAPVPVSCRTIQKKAENIITGAFYTLRKEGFNASEYEEK